MELKEALRITQLVVGNVKSIPLVDMLHVNEAHAIVAHHYVKEKEHMTRQHMVYSEGCMMGSFGGNLSHNPYELDSANSTLWLRGWFDAIDKMHVRKP